ncbi:MAG TPA: DUF6090 family protein [Xanthomonadales bacterium]|nr:DUF6090 family protein [Xanthomonadales bacterium]
MLFVFKKIRGGLLSSSQTKKYLAYAFGEVVLIVVGILIALQINNWNEDRIDRIRERGYLVSMLEDLNADITEIDAAVAGNTTLLAGLNRLLGLLKQDRTDEAYLRELFTHSLVYTYWYLQVEFPDLTLAQLKSSGDLLLIQNKPVRDALLTYEQGLEAIDHFSGEMMHYFHVMEETQKDLLDLSLGKPAYEAIEEDFLRVLNPLDYFEPLILEGDFLLEDDLSLRDAYYNDLLFYHTTLNNMNLALKEQKRRAEHLIQLIDEGYALDG